MAVIERDRLAHAAPRRHLAHPWDGIPRAGRLLVAVAVRMPHPTRWPVLGWFIRGYQAANASDLAAAVAFNALTALVPTSLLFVSVAGLFLQWDRVLETAVYTTYWALPPEQARDAWQAAFAAKRNFGWFSALSLLGFVWIGTNFVGCLARSMNHIYGARNRHFVHQRLHDTGVILVFALLFLLAALAATIPTLFIRQQLSFYFERWYLATALGQVTGYGIALLAALALFGLLYRVVPNAGQRLGDIWPGTLTAAIIFLLIAQVFPLFLRAVSGYNSYGAAFGFVSLVVAWFYALAHTLLFGTYVNASYRRWRRSKRAKRTRPEQGA